MTLPRASVIHLVDGTDTSDGVMVVPSDVYLNGQRLRTLNMGGHADDLLPEALASYGLAVDGSGFATIVEVLVEAARIGYENAPGEESITLDGIDLLVPDVEHAIDTGLDLLDGDRALIVRLYASAVHIVGAQDAPKVQEPAHA